MNARGLNFFLVLATLALGIGVVQLRLHVRHLRSQISALTREDVAAQVDRAAVSPPGDAALRDSLRETADSNPSGMDAAVWKTIQSTDLDQYARNLRMSGCPEATVRDIITGEVNRQFASRRAQLTTPGVPPFWQSAPRLSASEEQEREDQVRALEQERKDTLRTLLGVDPAIELRKNRDGFVDAENRLGHLSEEKQGQVGLVREKYNEKWLQVQAAVSADPGSSPDAVAAALQQLDNERLAQLSQILTPAEMLEYELQTSWTAIQLRQRLMDFQPTEVEFRAIYELQKPFDDEFVHRFNNRTDEAALLRKQEAQRQLEANYRSRLGEARYADFLKSSGPNP